MRLALRAPAAPSGSLSAASKRRSMIAAPMSWFLFSFVLFCAISYAGGRDPHARCFLDIFSPLSFCRSDRHLTHVLALAPFCSSLFYLIISHAPLFPSCLLSFYAYLLSSKHVDL